MPPRSTIGDLFDDADWDSIVVPRSEFADDPDFYGGGERGQRFETPDEVAAWVFDWGGQDFTYIIEYEDGTYGVYVLENSE